MSQRKISKIGLGTGSEIKINAVTRVFGPETSFDAEIFPVVDAPSGVPPQPIGKQQTRQGAVNRARAAQKSKPECDAFIGIENGMWIKNENETEQHKNPTQEQVWEDAAYVVMIIPAVAGQISETDDLILDALSDAIDIPPVEKRPFKTGRSGEWSILKDPHAVLTDGKKPREEFLVEAVERLKKVVIDLTQAKL